MHKSLKYILCLCAFLVACSSSNSASALDITIKDLTAPEITVNKKTYSITEGDSFDINDCYSVSDNLTKEPTVEIDDGGFNNKKAGTYTIKITATDESGNVTEDSFTVEVKEKPKPTPTPTPTPEATTEAKQSQQNSITNSQQEQSTTSQETSTPSNNTTSSFFPFLEGEHDGGEAAGNRCLAVYDSCIPYDSNGDGTYDGYLGQ